MSTWVRTVTIAEALAMGLVDVAAAMAHEAAAFGLLARESARAVADAPGCPAWYLRWWKDWASRGARP